MKIGIIGHFGGNKDFTDGQTVKTKTLYESLKNVENIELYKVDTYYLRHNIFKFIWQLMICVCTNKKIIFLLSDNGRRYLFPVFYYLNKLFNKQFYNCAIGGRLYKEIGMYKNFKKYVMSFEDNWLENKKLIKQLNDIGIYNARYVPNFKNITILDSNEMNACYDEPLEYCIFSRLTRKKGILDAINAISKINEKYGYIKCKLDLYGPIDEELKNDLDASLELHSKFVNYKGIINPNDSVDILKSYYCLLFPTQFFHEGIPGTIIDALSAGIPVIARNWEFCSEMIEDKFNGLVYNFEEPNELINCIIYSIENKKEFIGYKVNCLESAKKYNSNLIVNDLLVELKGK